MNLYLFNPPGRVERRGEHHFFGRLRLTQGLSLLKVDGFYRQVQDPSAEDVEAAQAAYLGGHRCLVSNAEATLLNSAGYGDWLTEVGYGTGAYGVGNFNEGGNGPFVPEAVINV
jgi:hypothetical protein